MTHVPNSADVPLPEQAYWLALKQVPNVGPARIRTMLDRFGTISNLWHASDGDIRRDVNGGLRDHLLVARREIDVQELYHRTTQDGVRIACWADEEYPRLLSEISAPPPILYYRGALIEPDTTAVAIVGTRRVTAYGREMAYRIAFDLAKAGVTIVSGLALGVDGIAHRAALEAGGRTIAVLGSGIDVLYPWQHRDLAKRIADQGAVVSDYPPGTKPDRFNFPPRNRIISGLSLGVVVVEAPEKSGALITVDFAAEQGRDAFAVPGPVQAPASAGCLKIIRDGATMVRSADDVLEDLHLRRNDVEPAAQPDNPALSDDERRLVSVLTGEPQHIDDIAAKINRSVSDVSGMLMMLQLQGEVRDAGSQFYARV